MVQRKETEPTFSHTASHTQPKTVTEFSQKKSHGLSLKGWEAGMETGRVLKTH